VKSVDDLVGKQFGRWVVLSKSSRVGEAYWLCECTCGSIKEVYGYALRKGNSQSCGCLAHERAAEAGRQNVGVLRGPRVDLVGQQRGRLLITAYAGSVKGRVMWECLCVCGNKIFRETGYLNKTGADRQSCGCWTNELSTARLLKYQAEHEHGARFIDYTGRRFGRLLVVSLSNKKLKGRIYWECLCDCGTTKCISRESLDSGRSNSCGCFRREDSLAKMLVMRPLQVGPNNPAWNPNLTDEDRVDRRSLLPIKEWAKEVKKRGEFTCQVCGKPHGNLNSHHLDSYRAHPERRLDPTNGVTLCVTCHKELHRQYGHAITYEWQYHEFKQNYLDNLEFQEAA